MTTATNTQILHPPGIPNHRPNANLPAIPIRPRERRPVAD
jgi:hypothetical protein